MRSGAGSRMIARPATIKPAKVVKIKKPGMLKRIIKRLT